MPSATQQLYVNARWAMGALQWPLAHTECMEAAAAFMAAALRYDLQAAVNRTTEQYQAELGAEHCTMEQARELRRLTVRACLPSEIESIVLADLDAPAPARLEVVA